MNEKLSGRILYLNEEDVKDFIFKEADLRDYQNQPLKNGILANLEKDSIIRIKFDVVGTSDYWDAYVIGFFYQDGKFLGHLHYISEAKSPNEPMTGNFKIIEGGYEIIGYLAQQNSTKIHFYINIKTEQIPPKTELEKELIKPKLNTNSAKPLKATPIKRDTFSLVLNTDLIEVITAKAEKIKKKKNRIGYDLYTHIANFKSSPKSADDLLIAMCVAYSWMPTMLNVYVKDKKEIGRLLIPLKKLGAIKSIEDFDKHSPEIEIWLTLLSKAINNSIVGASKVLHIFYQQNIPIIDSNVLKGWNIILRKFYKKYPELKLPMNISIVTNRQVHTYMKYWRLMLFMKKNTKRKTIRELEEPFYWIGMK